MPYMPPFIAPSRYTDAAQALEQVQTIYNAALAHLRSSMLRLVQLFSVIALNALTTFLQCGPLECPDNPVHYWAFAR